MEKYTRSQIRMAVNMYCLYSDELGYIDNIKDPEGAVGNAGLAKAVEAALKALKALKFCPGGPGSRKYQMLFNPDMEAVFTYMEAIDDEVDEPVVVAEEEGTCVEPAAEQQGRSCPANSDGMCNLNELLEEYTDDELVEELRRRGFTGSLERVIRKTFSL